MEVMDREISPSWKRKQKLRVFITIGLVSLLAISGLMGVRSLIKPSISRSAFTTARAEVGPVEATITASGVVIPEYERLITSPINAHIEKVVHNAGEPVQSGNPSCNSIKNSVGWNLTN